MRIASVRAVFRLSPRQIVYHVKRKLRNTTAHRFPGVYARYVRFAARTVPSVKLTNSAINGVALGIAQSAAPFYYDEYVGAIDDAAKGKFTFFQQSVDFGEPAHIEWHREIPAESDFHLWRMKLGHMGFICPMLIDGDETHLAAVSQMLRSYRNGSGFDVPGCFSSYWFPYSVSHRIIAILSGYVLALDGRALPGSLREEVEAFLQWNVGFLLVNVEHELRNNHVERNLAALCFYFSCTGSVPPKLRRRLDREVRRVVRACVLPDGLIAERSAMYQGLAVMALDIFSKSSFLSDDTRAMARATYERAVRAWLTMTHPDGEIALFNDSWFGEVPKVGDIVHDDELQPVGLLPDAGYARLEAEGVFVLMDAGPIGPGWNPGHGHADFLGVETDISGKRFLVDPGTFQYSTGPRRAFERSAQSHNGPIRAGVEPIEYFGCFRVGRMREAELTGYVRHQNGGSARGQLSLPDGSSVVRSVKVSPRLVNVTDEWVGAVAGAQVRLTVPEEWILDREASDRLVFHHGNDEAEICVIDGRVGAVETGEWSHSYLLSRGATIVSLQPATEATTGGRVVWTLRVGSQTSEVASGGVHGETDG